MNRKMKLLTIVLVVAVSAGVFFAVVSACAPSPPQTNGIIIGRSPPEQTLIVPIGTVYLDTVSGKLWQYTTQAVQIGGASWQTQTTPYSAATWYTTGWFEIYNFNK